MGTPTILLGAILWTGHASGHARHLLGEWWRLWAQPGQGLHLQFDSVDHPLLCLGQHQPQATGIDAGREGRGARGIGNAVTLRRSPCHWHKEVAVCEGSLLIHPFLLSSPHFASVGKAHTQGWCGWAIFSHYNEQEHPACMLGIVWVHAWSSLCPSHTLLLLSSLPTGICHSSQLPAFGNGFLIYWMRAVELAEI